jgi:hypothetical protein
MTNEVPGRFRSTAQAIDTVCAEFGAGGGLRSFSDGRWIRDLDIAWTKPVQHVAFILDTEARLLVAYVILDLPHVPTARNQLAQAVARANYGLLPGCFEIDLDGGQTRYRSVVPLGGEGVTTREVAQLLADALEIAAAYAPSFNAVAGGDDPALAIDRVELEG